MSVVAPMLVAEEPKRTIAEQIERTLACAILRSEFYPGSRLPSVRTLAVQFETTVPTIQRALDRLAATGLVTAKRGSGIVVNDPERCADLNLLPLWFEAYSRNADRCAKMLGELLELRRVLTVHLFRSSGERVRAAIPKLSLIAMLISSESSLREIAVADAEMTRIVVASVDNFALRSVFETVARLALEAPHVAEALYGDRAAHQKVINAVVAALADPNPAAAALSVERVMANWDAHVVEQFRQRIANPTP